MNINTPSACHPLSSTFRTPSRGRRVGAPRDLAGDAFGTRVRAFLNGRFFELLSSTLDLTIAPNSPQNQSQYPLYTPPPIRSLRSRALEVRDLVRVGELSRAVTRADAAQLADHSASTISSLAQLHPDAPHPSDTPAPRTDILPPPLKPPATPLCDPLIITTMLTKFPLSSAADHGGWRYEHLKWTFSLDSVRDRPSDAQDSLDPTSSFVAGRGARAMIALIRFAFNGGIPPSCRTWFLGGRLIALRKEGDILPPTAGFGPLQLALCLAVWCLSALRLALPSASPPYFSRRQLNPAHHGLVRKRTGHHIARPGIRGLLP